MSINHICNQIKKLRREKGISQEFLAENLGIDQTTYSRIENGDADLTVRRLESISLLLGVDPSTFFQGNVIPLQPIYTQLKDEKSELQEELIQLKDILELIRNEVHLISKKMFSLSIKK